MSNHRSKLLSNIIAGFSAGLSLILMSGAASADNVKMRFAYLLADSVLPIMAAKDTGAFEAAGIDLEMTEVQGGPAVVAAIASGEADIGYAAPVPPINARLNGVPVKMVLALAHEVDPDKKFIWLVASKASGVTSLADIKGKKISFNANGGLCELTWRDHLAAAGIAWSDVEPVVLPFPQQEASLEQGAIDAACTINPFYASMSGNANVAPVTIAAGMLAEEKTPVINDVIFTTEDYLGANKDSLVAFAKVLDKARKDMQADRAALEAAAVKYMGLTPEAAKSFNLPIVKDTMSIAPGDAQTVLDAMNKAGMLSSPITGEDLSIQLDY